MNGEATPRPALSIAAAILVAIIAGVHLQQYLDFIALVPTIGVLFLLNAAGGAGLAVALLSRDRLVRLLGAVGSLGLAAGSLISIVVALESSLFGYSEPSLRLPIVIAILAELAAIPVLAVLARDELRSGPVREGAPNPQREL